MVKKSKKSKSKRVPLRKKYKILKRVKQHHKKKAKEAKKLGNKRRPKVEKDPGIPNDWPFKEQELKALEARRARALEELEQKKALRKERAQKRKLGLLDQDNEQNFAKEKGAEESGSKISKTRDNSERAFYKELIKVIDTSDVILEVLDARDPLGTRCVEMEKLVLKSGPDKHLVLLLNKIDLVPREAAEKWLKYLREELPAVAFKCSTQEQRSNLGWKSASKAAKTSNALQTSDCLGAETLLKLLKNYSRSHELKKSITVGVVGLPNVGKSSLINSLKRSHVVNVGSTPGLTRSMQEVQLDKHVKLLDCPGVVMLRPGESGISIALRNCKRIEKLDDPIGPVKEILKLCPAQKLMSLYKLPSFSSVDEFLLKVATLRGKLKKGGTVDVEAAARIVLRDWNEGKIPYYTFPPVRNQGENLESAIVSELGKEFNVDEIYNEESSFIGSLKPIIDSSHVEVPSSSPLNMDAQILEPEDENQIDGESMENQGEEESMACDETEATQTKPKTSRGQNDKLYKEEGILNPRKVRAEKKRRKALKLARSSEMDADYDFKVDYTKGRRSMTDMADEDSSNDDDDYDGDDDGHGDDDDHDHRENDASGSAPMAGVELEA